MKITKEKLKKIIREELAYSNFEGSLLDLDDHNMLENTVEQAAGKLIEAGYEKEDVIEALKGIVEDL